MPHVVEYNQNQSLSKNFTAEILAPSIDLSVDYSEIYLDDLIENEALKEIPLVKSVVGVIKAGISINQFWFAKKLLTFIQEFNSNSIEPEKKEKFQTRVLNDCKFRKKVVEQTMVFIDRHIVVTKTKISAQLFKAFVEEKIDFSEYTALNISLEEMHPDSFQFLDELSLSNFEVSQDKKADKKFDEQALLLSSGLARETSSWSHGFIVSESGKKLFELGINPIFKK
ncbi:hypothetical protein [Ancylomarina sp. 16SWW S1-10-2]|uniref:hypothetical protein n=1 Tax=Ancylomarina sp. 16SWW S1-10-2 TaxID=2499681 RepID=UPI0012AEA018|nr:hypothetical protein [Ancylomarina sp. 16SWW S1-10-2]MRT93567.1 hypothetical protein [Ancylomarina sp. 16SWW S1-10-2]